MKDKRKAYEEKLDAQFGEWNAQLALPKAGAKLYELKTAGDEASEDLKRGAEKPWYEVKTTFPDSDLKVQFSKTNGHAANRRARSLAEAIILQSIEDLWNPVSRRGSLRFFKSDGFALCSEIAGISYIKQLAMFRMLADVGRKTSLRNIRKNI